MSIQTELTRITNAKAAIKAAIEGKGVTVPDGTLLDGMAAMIEAIEAGGGIEKNRLVSVAKGSFTVSERTVMSNDSRFILTHNSGVIPILIYISAGKVSAQSDFDKAVFFRVKNASVYESSIVLSLSSRMGSSSSSRTVSFGTETGGLSGNSWTTEQVSLVCFNASLYFNAGITYTWRAYYVE